MTHVAAISADLRRRVVLAAGALALAAALAAPATAAAETYCVTPVSGGCTLTFATKARALEQANRNPGPDTIRQREGAQVVTVMVPDAAFPDPTQQPGARSGITKVQGPSFFENVTNFMLTWLPLIFMGVICLLIGLTMRFMPRTKPQEIKPDTSQSTRWGDVAGAEEAKEELREVVEFLRDPKRFKKLGAKVPRGILLHGPPGTGKTLLAKAVANESKAKFYAQSASSFVEMFAGLGAARIRRLFREARKSAPAIIFIDELDAVGATRGKDVSGEKDQTLNQLLVEMDGFAGSDDLVVIGASNLLDKLDPALLRPGRFDRQIYVSPPDLTGRLEILRVHSRDKPLHEVDLEVVARQTSGLTGADLANICNEAAIFAGRHRRDVVMMQDFDAALERVVAGMQSRKVMNDHEKRVIAYHEAGHALCGELLPSQDKTHRISIIPRGHALGYTLHLPDEDRYLKSKEEMIDRMVVLLGGRVAEHVVFGAITTGASNDLQRVYELSRAMVAEYGMGTHLGSRRLPADDYSVSDATRRMVDEEQQELTDLAWRRARKLIEENRDALEKLALGLLANEVLERPTIERIMAERGGDGAPIAQLPAAAEPRIAAAERLEP
jgi:cell division protease FtsH